MCSWMWYVHAIQSGGVRSSGKYKSLDIISVMGSLFLSLSVFYFTALKFCTYITYPRVPLFPSLNCASVYPHTLSLPHLLGHPTPVKFFIFCLTSPASWLPVCVLLLHFHPLHMHLALPVCTVPLQRGPRGGAATFYLHLSQLRPVKFIINQLIQKAVADITC